MDKKSIFANWQAIQEALYEATVKAGRSANAVQVVGVAKKQPIDRIKFAVEAGLKIIGENYAQEFLLKAPEFHESEVTWHFVGHLQSNKAKDLVGKIDLIHSVDRLSVATAISKLAVLLGIRQKILIEVNLDQEDSKSGIMASAGPEFLQKLQTFEGLQVCGLMGMPALDKSADEMIRSFQNLRQLSQKWESELDACGIHQMRELSMGTTADFRYAVEQGATLVRLGTVLFGQRGS